MSHTHRSFAAVLCSALLVGTLFPTAALAEPSSELEAQLEEAQTTLGDLYANAEEVSNELNKTVDDLTVTEAGIKETTAQIDTKQLELEDAQHTLGQTMAERYKEGHASLVSLVLSSSSIEEFVSNVYYANKISESYNQQINAVRQIQEDLEQKRETLEEQKESLEKLRADQQAQKDELDARAAEAESYVSGLSDELQDALAAEEAARAEAARAEAAAALAEAGGSEETGAPDVDDKPAESEEESEDKKPEEKPEQKPEEKPQEETEEQEEQPQDEEEREPEEPQEEPEEREPEEPQEEPEEQEPEEEEPEEDESQPESGDDAEEPSSGEPSNMDARTAVVNYVLAQVGKPYVWATHGPNSFDCSGLAGAAYDSIGYSVGYSDSYQAQYCNKPASEAVYGDIVWRPGHVGICIGGGVTVEAFNPARGVGYGSVDTFVRAGSPLG